MSTWIIQERTELPGIKATKTRTLIRNDRESVEETLREAAEDAAKKGFVLAKQDEERIVLERNGERHILLAYEAQDLPEETETISAKIYRVSDDIFLEVMRDKVLGEASVYIYDRKHPGAKVGVRRDRNPYTDAEILAASVTSVRNTLEKGFERKA